MAANRMRQVNELIRAEFANALFKNLELPTNVVVSVTKVRTAPDLKNATVYITVLPDNHSGSVLNTIRRNMSHIIAEVRPRVILKIFPKIKVQIDEVERGASHIEALLDSLKKPE